MFTSILRFIKTKLKILELYKVKLKHPFQEGKAVESLALLRGSESNLDFAEAFALIKSIE